MGGSSSTQRSVSYTDQYLTQDENFTYELSNSSFDETMVESESIEIIKDATMLQGVLTTQECGDIVKHMFPNKKRYKENHKSFPVLFRAWDPNPEAALKQLGVRIFTRSQQVADALFERTKAHLPQQWIQYTAEKKEVWKLKGLHDRIRFVCYEKGQNFPPHYDDPTIHNPTCRSFLTFVMYLSKSGAGKKSNFCGGEFMFLNPKNNNEELLVISPDPGLVVVFPHKTLHGSKALTRGFKFMIRSDVMYELVSLEELPRQN